jgi:predicted nuclease of restriction endonuclease-like RecB superfamily
VRFSLQDIKKQVHRRGGELFVGLQFLRPGEMQTEIERLITFHEQLLGQPRRLFSIDDARACIGDYRLAYCLINTLSAWYHWRQCDWSITVQRMGSEAQQHLDQAEITSPVYLRLALYNYVNAYYRGFLDIKIRAEALQKFAALYQLNVPDLEYLLVLDSDEEAMLARDAPQPPAAQDVATLYNQWAFEAALFNASSVQFVIDCNAFEEANTGGTQSSRSKTGIGAVIKRLCYLARLLGVYYDLAYDPTTPGSAPHLQLTLYGPQEMTGAPQQYGMRLARLCRLLLGYGMAQGTHGRNKQKHGVASGQALSKAIIKAEATVHFLQRSYTFVMDHAVLSLLPSTDVALAGTSFAPAEAPSVFDSSIEQSFAEAFNALEKSQAVDGWQLIREPEPLLLERSIFIPDFALTRAQKRLYIEILGFWTSSYRERKIQKLQQLQGRDDIVLAIPEEAKEAFTSIAGMFPIVFYDTQMSATELLKLLRNHYDDFPERLASIDVATVQQRVESEGFLSERPCYEMLRCYRRSELPLAAERVIGQGIVFVAGIGMYQLDWMEHLRISFVELIGSAGVLSLADLFRASRERWLPLAHCEDATLEAILGLWPEEIHVRRTSIFEATVELVNQETLYAVGTQFPASQDAASDGQRNAAKKPPREKRAPPKKRVVREAAQSDLWG